MGMYTYVCVSQAIKPSVTSILFKTWKVLQEMNYYIAKGLFLIVSTLY